MTIVQVPFPDDVFAWYRRGLLSQGRAAQLAGLSRADFLSELAARKIDVFHVDMEELKREVGLG